MLLPSRLNVDISTEVLEILQSAHRLHRTDAPMKAMVVSVWRFLDVRVRFRNPQVVFHFESCFIFGYGSIPINAIFRGMTIHKSQLF